MKQSISIEYKIFILILAILLLTFSMPYIVEKVMEHRDEQQQNYKKRKGLDEPIIEGFLGIDGGGGGGMPDPFEPFKKPIADITDKVDSITKGVSDIPNKLNSLGDEIKSNVNSVTDDLTSKMNSVSDDITSNVNSVTEDLTSELSSVGGDLLSQVTSIFQGILQILMYFFQIITGLPLLITGIGTHFLCGGLEFKDGFINGIQVLGILLKCGLNSFVKFFNGQCTIFYIIDIIYGTLYKICIELPIVLLKNIIGLNLQFIVDLIHDLVIVPVDTLIFGLSGYHITKWSDSIVSKCYKCKGTLNGQDLELQYYQWGKMFNCTNAEIMHGVYKMMYSLFPIDRHWMTWVKGRHLDGADDEVG
jgi:hypothetical protein